MKKYLLYFCIFVLLGGFFLFFSFEQKAPLPSKEDRSFVIVVPVYQPKDRLKSILDSILTQSYKKYRIVLIDDGSNDHTTEEIEFYLHEKSHSLLPTKLITTKEHAGPIQRLYECCFTCQDQQVLILLDQHQSFNSAESLATLNNLFKQKDPSFILAGKTTEKPFFFSTSNFTDYLAENGLLAISVREFKKLSLECFFHQGRFLFNGQKIAFLSPLQKMSGSNYYHSPYPLSEKPFSTYEKPFSFHKESSSRSFKERKNRSFKLTNTSSQSLKADLIVFSCDRPLELYSLLESAQEKLSNLDTVTVIYQASTNRFALSYEELKSHFSDVTFLQQSSLPEKDFKPLLEETLFNTQKKSSYVLFAVDGLVFLDKVDLSTCIDMMGRTASYFFSLRLGDHINFCYKTNKQQIIPQHVKIPENIFAYQIACAEGDFGYMHSLEATLYRKEDLKKTLPLISYKNPHTLEDRWNKTKKDSLYEKQKRVGLYFSKAKVVNIIPLNLVNTSEGHTSNPYSPEDLLERFEKNKKIDWTFFQTVSQDKVHMEMEPQFVPRKKKEIFLFHPPLVLEEEKKG